MTYADGFRLVMGAFAAVATIGAATIGVWIAIAFVAGVMQFFTENKKPRR